MEPAYSFSVPSIEDDTPLDCRIYHPKNLHFVFAERQPVRGAVVAHPYPPLGGCHDDSVVLAVTEAFLEQGFIVGTFNFRGAGDSEGRTSWGGKPEQGDYSSVAGFFTYYLQNLIPTEDLYRLETIPSASRTVSEDGRTTWKTSSIHVELLLAGYSYGSLVLARLQPISDILQRLDSAEMGTAGAELILRARTLAKQTRNSFEDLQSPASPRGRQQLRPGDAAPSPTKRIGASPITMGGEETDPSARRRSKDSRRSTDFVRKSVEMPNRVKARMKRSSMPGPGSPQRQAHDTPAVPATPATPTMFGIEGRLNVRVRYLVISPVLLPFTQMLCPPGPPSMMAALRRPSNSDSGAVAQLLQNPTLAVFGSTDVFTSAKRLKRWAQNMEKDSDSNFEWHEIEKAGHFWREQGVMQALQEKVTGWIKSQSDTKVL